MKDWIQRLRARCGELWWYTILLFVAQRFGDAINMFVGLWLVPRYVTQDELGAVLPLTQAVNFIALPLAVISIPFMKFITVFTDRGEDGKAKAFVRDVFLAVGAMAVVSFAIAYFALPLIFERIKVTSGSLGILVVAIAVLGASSSIFGYAVQGFRMYSATIWIQVLQAPLRLILVLVAMPFRALSGYMVGQASGPIVQIATALVAFRRRFGRAVRPAPYWQAYGRAICRYTLPFAIWTVVGTVAASLDTLVIRHRLPEVESAGYYMLTRFTEIASYLGLAVTGFLFPMVASRAATDATALRLLRQSIVGAVLGGGAVVALLSAFGRPLLGLLPEWSAYAPLAGLFPVIGVTTVLVAVMTCLVTYETAQGRFGFLWWAAPVCAAKSVLLYAVTSYPYFEGKIPAGLYAFVDALAPRSLKFAAIYLLVSQILLLAGFAPALRRAFARGHAPAGGLATADVV